MKRSAKKYKPGHRKIVRSRADIPPHFVSEDEEREWWATHELATTLLMDEAATARSTAAHRTLIGRLQPRNAAPEGRQTAGRRKKSA